MSRRFDELFRSTDVQITSDTELAAAQASKTLSTDQTATDNHETRRNPIHAHL
jgi:hypothetical protein